MLIDHEDYWWFIRSLVTCIWSQNSTSAIEELFAKASQMGVYSSEALEEGLIAAIKAMDDSVVQDFEETVYHNLAVVMKSTELYKEEERFMQVVRHAKDTEKLIQLTLW